MSLDTPPKHSSSELPNVENVLVEPTVPDTAASLVEAKPEKRRIRPIHKIIAGVASAAVLGGIGIGVNAIAQGPEKEEPVATAPETPGTNEGNGETEAPLDVTQLPEDVIEYNLFESLSEAQQAEILEMKNESVDEFRQRPYDEQLVFSKFVFDNNIDILKYRLDQSNLSYIYENLDLNTGEGVNNNQTLKYLLLVSLKTYSDDDGVVYDLDTALKASAYIHTPGSEGATNNIDTQLNTVNINTPAIPGEATVEDSATLENGDIVLNVRNPLDGSVIQSTYTQYTYADINGKSITDRILNLSVPQSDPRFDADIHN